MKYPFIKEQDEMIMRTYREIQPDAGRSPVVRLLADKLKFPRWVISRRARDIGAYEPRLKEPVWSEKELKILERNAHHHPETIRRHLKKSGFIRSITGIIIKRKRMRFLKGMDEQSVTKLAMCFGVDVHSVSRWIKEGLLKAQMRGTQRTERQGGDIYYIRDQWIRDFIKENIGLIDIRKVDKFWFVDVMSL